MTFMERLYTFARAYMRLVREPLTVDCPHSTPCRECDEQLLSDKAW